jgi:Spy/CpxP family protein refolding chaperone
MRGRVPAALLFGFILGAAAGSWGQRAMFHRYLRSDPERRSRMLERLSRALSLDDKQKAEVAAIMESKHADIDRLKAETFSRLAEIRKSADADMSKVLTPEQAAKLEAMHHVRPQRIDWEMPATAPAR